MIYPEDTSVKKKRNTKPKGVESKRQSYRKTGEEMIELKWLADLSYRTKVMAKPISSYKLSSCTKLDAIRFKNALGI